MENFIKTLKTDDFEMEYVTFGEGKKPLIIVPGLSIKNALNSAATMPVIYKDFCTNYSVYVFDIKKNISKGYSLQNMAKDLAIALKQLGIAKAAIFGTSQGGMVSQYMAISNPELVSKLVLGSSTSHAEPLQLKVIDNWVKLAEANNANDLINSFIDEAFSKNFALRYRRALNAMYKNVTQQELSRFATLARECDFVDTYNDLGKIKCPVFVIAASDDRVVTPIASTKIVDKLKQENCSCEFYMYDGYGHAVYDEAKDYKSRILNFLES